MTAARTRAVSVVAEALFVRHHGVNVAKWGAFRDAYMDDAEAVVAALEAAGLVAWQEGEG